MSAFLGHYINEVKILIIMCSWKTVHLPLPKPTPIFISLPTWPPNSENLGSHSSNSNENATPL